MSFSRFSTTTGRKPLGREIRDMEDAYWEPPRFECTKCGAEESKNPSGYEYSEFLCPACEEQENNEAAEYIDHMRQVAREGTR